MIEIHMLSPKVVSRPSRVSAYKREVEDVVRAQEGYLNCRRPKVRVNLKRQSRLVDQ